MASPYLRQIHFRDTDAAGVVYFSNLLSICHEAYEVMLQACGIELVHFFSDRQPVAVPIVHAEIDFYQPLFCGDQVSVYSLPELRQSSQFLLSYKVCHSDLTLVAEAKTHHICIDSSTRQQQPLPTLLSDWLQHVALRDREQFDAIVRS
ncbi:MAG: thioesterase family protein [Cyanobacteria bacterium P01_H01_bin.121]